MSPSTLTCGWLLGLGACFHPSAASGVPCDPAVPRCPTGQACVHESGAFVCSTGSGDGPDALESDDDDGDGVLDLADNCPMLSNPGQDNYDRDRFGDACDPCPPYANDAPIDGDNDGVSDDCDPDPAIGGDRVMMFDAFGSLSSWTATGTWTASADGVDVDLGSGAQATMTRPISVTTRTSVTAAFTATAMRTFGGYAAMGTVVGVEPDRSVHCAMLRNPTTDEHIALIDTKSESALAADDMALDLGRTYTSTITATALGYRCRAGSHEITATGTATTEVGLRARGSRGTFHWILVVAGP